MKKINVEFKDLPFAVEEALNRLRVNIKFCGRNTQKIMISSSVPKEGKSFVSMHLWKMLADAGFKTVFVDLDLRESQINKRHNIQLSREDKGLDYYLSGMAEYEDVIYETNIENGYMIPSSSMLENPSVLLEDPRFSEMLDKLAKEYRYIIIDTPPLYNVTDGALVASMCDGAVMVVRNEYTSRKLVKQSLQQLERVGCKLLGVVLNRVQSSGHKYGKYYGYDTKYRQDEGKDK